MKDAKSIDNQAGTAAGWLPKQPATRRSEVTEEEIQSWLVAKIAKAVDVSQQQIDIRRPFEHYGLDSMHAMHLSSDLQDWLGRKLSPTIIWDYATIELLAHHLMTEE